jgi:hypothetical protein
MSDKMDHQQPSLRALVKQQERFGRSVRNMRIHVQHAREHVLRGLREPEDMRAALLDAFGSLKAVERAWQNGIRGVEIESAE